MVWEKHKFQVYCCERFSLVCWSVPMEISFYKNHGDGQVTIFPCSIRIRKTIPLKTGILL